MLIITLLLSASFFAARAVFARVGDGGRDAPARRAGGPRENFQAGERVTYGMRARYLVQGRAGGDPGTDTGTALREVDSEPSDAGGSGGGSGGAGGEPAYEPPEPHLRFWEQRGPGAVGSGGGAYDVEMNADRSLLLGVQYAVTLEAEKRPGVYKLANVIGDLVVVEGAESDGTIAYEKGAAYPPRMLVTFSAAASGRTPSECFSVIPVAADSDGAALPIAFAPDISDHRRLVNRVAKLGDPSGLTASVSTDGLLTIRCKNSSEAPASLLKGSLKRAAEPFGFGKAVYGAEFKATDPKALASSFAGGATVFSGVDGSGDGGADGSGDDVIYSWTYDGPGEPSWRQSGEPANQLAAIVRGLAVPRAFSPLIPGPKWIAVMQLSDGMGPLFRITYAVAGEDSGVPGYFKEAKGPKGAARCGTISGVPGAAEAACPKECALACDSLDDCAGFAWDLPGDDPEACKTFCGDRGTNAGAKGGADGGRCRLLGSKALTAKPAEGNGCVQQVYVKTAVPHGFKESVSVAARTRRGEGGGAAERCFDTCNSKSLFNCSSVGLSPARSPTACATYPLTISADKGSFQVFPKALPAPRLAPGETTPAPPSGYLTSPLDTRQGLLLHTAATGASSLRQCAAKCLGDASCASFSWAAAGGNPKDDSKVCMLIPDDQDPVYDREPVFCGEYSPLFKYVPIPMPPGRHAGTTYPPSRPVDDPTDTTCKGPDCKHQCEMDCLRACDTDDGCYGFVVAPTDPADPGAGMYCRMIGAAGVDPRAATDESPRTGVISFRKVLDGSSYDPLKSGGACTDICGGSKGKGLNALFCGGNASKSAADKEEEEEVLREMEETGAESLKNSYIERKNLYSYSPNKGSLEYEAETMNQCAAKCDADTDCVMFSWDPFAQVSTLTGRKSGCRLLNAEEYDRSAYTKAKVVREWYWKGAIRRSKTTGTQNFEKKNWNAVTTKSGD